VEIIEAQLKGSGTLLQMVQAHWPSPVNVVAQRPEHYLFLYLPPIGFRGEGRFPEFGQSAYRPISSVFFRPADVPLEARGTGGHTRLVRFAMTQQRLNAILDLEVAWNADECERGLDLNRSALKPTLLRLMNEANEPGFASAALVDALGVTAVVELMRNLSGGASRAGGNRGSLRAAQIARIRERCMMTDAPCPTVTELARLSGMSERNLLRLFKKTMGETVVGYVSRARIDTARVFLRDTNFALKEVAHRLGFASHSSFSAAFHREVGVTPLQFRRSQRRSFPVVSS
jgi:AraC family transcriptional regulator